MSEKQAKKFRKLNRKTSETLITQEVKRTVRQLAIRKTLYKWASLLELIIIVVLIILLI